MGTIGGSEFTAPTPASRLRSPAISASGPQPFSRQRPYALAGGLFLASRGGSFLESASVPAANPPAPGRWNHRKRAVRADQLEHGVAVVALIGDDCAGLDVGEQDRSQGAVVNVPWRQLDLPRSSLRINTSMKLRGISASRNANRLALGPPFPPAACW